MRILNIKEFRKYDVAQDKKTRATQNDAGATEPTTITGYAAVFNQPSKLLAELDNGQVVMFYEVLRPTAFDRVLAEPDLDCIYCVDHSTKSNKMISRTKAGTLKLSVDDYGLNFTSNIPNTTMANDLVEHIRQGNLAENSFCFTVDENSADVEWSEPDQDGIRTRYINYVSGLYDVSTVITPAYNNTSLSLRGLEILKQDLANATNKAAEPATVKVESAPVIMVNELDSIDLELLLLK